VSHLSAFLTTYYICAIATPYQFLIGHESFIALTFIMSFRI